LMYKIKKIKRAVLSDFVNEFEEWANNEDIEIIQIAQNQSSSFWDFLIFYKEL